MRRKRFSRSSASAADAVAQRLATDGGGGAGVGILGGVGKTSTRALRRVRILLRLRLIEFPGDERPEVLLLRRHLATRRGAAT